MGKYRKSYNKRRVNKLWVENPHCHWCNILTTREGRLGKNLPDNAATFDHLYHRSDPQRFTKKGRNAGVLACYACNQKRGRIAHIASLPAWNRFLIRYNFPIPVWKIRRKVAHVKRRFRFITKRVNWLKRHLKFRYNNWK